MTIVYIYIDYSSSINYECIWLICLDATSCAFILCMSDHSTEHHWQRCGRPRHAGYRQKSGGEQVPDFPRRAIQQHLQRGSADTRQSAPH